MLTSTPNYACHDKQMKESNWSNIFTLGRIFSLCRTGIFLFEYRMFGFFFFWPLVVDHLIVASIISLYYFAGIFFSPQIQGSDYLQLPIYWLFLGTQPHFRTSLPRPLSIQPVNRKSNYVCHQFLSPCVSFLFSWSQYDELKHYTMCSGILFFFFLQRLKISRSFLIQNCNLQMILVGVGSGILLANQMILNLFGTYKIRVWVFHSSFCFIKACHSSFSVGNSCGVCVYLFRCLLYEHYP